MNIRSYFQKISETDKEKLVRRLYDKELGRLTKLLRHGNLEVAKFTLKAKYHLRHNTFIVSLGLKVIKNNLRAEEVNKNLVETFDLAFTNLINQLRKLENIKHKAR